MSKKKQVSDFRYDTGNARIPWAAVGEKIGAGDVVEIVKFLMPAGKGAAAKAHAAQLARVAAEVRRLAPHSRGAGKLTLGNQVRKLEERAARLLGARHAVFLTNATAGFEIAYKYAGLGPGDEVIAPAITFISTIAYPLSVGAKVVLADLDPRTLNMDPRDVARKITRRTRVVIPVHLGGYPVDMDPIMALAKQHNLVVIEDAAHAFGARYKGRMLGTIGHFGAFSFHEVKNITSFGEGGILVTNLPIGKDLGKCRFLGLDVSRPVAGGLYDVRAMTGKRGLFVAGNHSATEIQALGLLLQMNRLRKILAKRRQAAAYLNARFRNIAGLIVPPLDSRQVMSTHHLYLLQIDPDRVGGDIQALKAKLAERGVVNIPHFAPLYKFSVMRQMGYDTAAIERSCPVAEGAFCHRFTHLPLYDFNRTQLSYMADAVIQSVRELRAPGRRR